MEEPEINIDNENKTVTPAPKRKSTLKRVILVLIVLLLLVVGGGVYYVKATYNEAYLIALCESEISKATDGECKVGSIKLSLMGSIEISDITLAPKEINNRDKAQFLKIAKINGNIDILKSITNFQPVLTLMVDGINLEIERVSRKRELSAEERKELRAQAKARREQKPVVEEDKIRVEEFSTNINRVIASIVDLPWKDWVAGFNWKIANVDIRVKNTSVRVHDQGGELGDVDFTVDFTASLKKTGTKMNLVVNEVTPTVKDGKVELGTSIAFDWDEATRRPDKPLAFIGSSDIDLTINNLDLGYLGKYYMQTDKQKVRLAAPVYGKMAVRADDLSEVKLDFQLSSEKIVVFYEDGKKVDGGEPGLKITAGAQVDLSNEWSNIKTGFVNISSFDASNKNEMLKFASQVFGSFGDEVVVSIQSNIDVGGISASSVGKAFEFYNIAKGAIEFGSELTWKKNADWGYDFNLRSKDLVVKNNGIAVPAPIAMLASGIIKPLEEFSPESLTVQMKLDAPGVEVITKKDVSIPLTSGSFFPQGEANVSLDVPEIFKAFAAPLNKFGVKSINEVLTLALKMNSQKSANLVAEMKNTKGQYAPCVIKLSYTPKGTNGFVGSSELIAENKAVQVRATAEGETATNGATTINFTKQYALRIGAGLNLLKRIQNIIPGLEVAQYPVTGVMRGKANGRMIVNGDDIAVAANNSMVFENMIFTTDSGKKFVEKKAAITSSFSIKDLLEQQLLNVKSFDVTGDSINIKVKVDSIGLGDIAKDAITGLEKVEGLEVKARFGEMAFSNLSALLGDSIPAWAKSGKSFELDLLSKKGGTIELKKFDLDGAGLVASVSDLIVNPKALVAAIDSNNMEAVVSGLSPFSIKISANNSLWGGLDLPIGLKFSGKADIALAFDPKLDRLTLSKIVLAGDRNNRAFITRMSAATIVDNVSKLVSNPTLPLILESLPSGVNIPVITVSIPILKEYLVNSGDGSTPNIDGREIELVNLRIVKTKTKDTLQLVGAINSSGMTAENMIKYSGSAKLNNLIALNGNSLAITGEVKLDDAAIVLRATPYVYNKPVGVSSKIYYKLVGDESGMISIDRAGIAGGDFQFDMSKLVYVPRSDGKFKLELPMLKVTAPFDLKVSGVSIDPDRDSVVASVTSSGIDLNKMNSSLDTGMPSKLGGSIGAFNLAVSEKYSTVFSEKDQKLSSGNKLSVEPSSVSLTSTKGPTSMTIGVGKIQGSSADGKFSIGGINITSPTGFSDPTPIRVGQIDSTLNLDSLAVGETIIDEVIVSSFKAIYEMKLPKNNISVLQSNIKTLLPEPPQADNVGTSPARTDTGRPASGVSSGSSVSSGGSKGGVLIKNLYLNNGVVNIKSNLINTDIKIPQTHIENVGGDNPRVAFTTIINVLLRSIGKASVSILNDSTGNAVKSVTNILGEALKNKDKAGNEKGTDEDPVKSVTNLLKGVLDDGGKDGKTSDGDKTQDSINKGVDALKGLFK